MATDRSKQQSGNPVRTMSARLARSLTGSRSKTNPVLDPLLSIHKEFHPKADVDLISRAYDTAERLHDGVVRKSGDPYITHPLAVATIAAEIGMDTTTVVAALLHDTVEDTDYSLESLTEDFGPEVARLVDGVTKLDKLALGAAAEAETIRKMIVAMAQDPRVLVIKVADRLHNMRTMRFLPPEKQARKARQTLEVIAPLAHRLGMVSVKWELEDLAFAILYPKKYDEIVRLVADRAPERDRFLAEVISRISKELKDNNIDAEVVGRPKHYWSIYQKMVVRRHDFDEIFDLVGIRVLVENLNNCYAAIGVVHSVYSAMPGRFKDYISSPKFGVYQSLHTTVITPGGKTLEVQVRTHEMHYNAEFGIAAHWRYKESKSGAKGDDELNQMSWMRQLLDWQKEAADPNEFLDSLRYDLTAKQIFVFTPKGDVINLPYNATPVDFAYAVHTEVGHRCIGAKVNGKLVALESTLHNGDKVEIFTSKDKNSGPSRDWKDFVVSARAKTKIRQWFAKERREEYLEAGRDALAAEAQRGGLPLHRLFTGKSMKAVAAELHHPDIDSLYTAIGSGSVSAQHVVNRLMAAFGGEEEAADTFVERTPLPEILNQKAEDELLESSTGVLVQGSPDVMAKLAQCCHPVPGDKIFGFVTRGGGVSVHRMDCPNSEQLHSQPERIIQVSWAMEGSGAAFAATLHVEALDRGGLLYEVTKVLKDLNVSLVSMNSHTNKERIAEFRFTFSVSDTKQLGALITTLRNTEGVYDVFRVMQ